MDFSELMSLATGHAQARIVQTAVELNVFEALSPAALTAREVALRLNLDPAACALLLDALSALGLLTKEAARFSLTDATRRFLTRSSPRYVGDMLRFESSLWACWEKLPQAIHSGNPARQPDMYQAEPAETETFIAAMDSLVKARGDAEVIARILDWDDVRELLDLGSGPATYPIALCRAFPALRATVFDLPATLTITRRFVADAGMENRIRLIAGDYRTDPVPGRYQRIFLSNIVHGENDERNRALIRKLADNLEPGGRMIVKDHILDESRTAPAVGAVFSLLMLLTTDGGRCYTLGEVRAWMEYAGLSDVRQIDLPTPLTSALVIGTK